MKYTLVPKIDEMFAISGVCYIKILLNIHILLCTLCKMYARKHKLMYLEL